MAGGLVAKRNEGGEAILKRERKFDVKTGLGLKFAKAQFRGCLWGFCKALCCCL